MSDQKVSIHCVIVQPKVILLRSFVTFYDMNGTQKSPFLHRNTQSGSLDAISKIHWKSCRETGKLGGGLVTFFNWENRESSFPEDRI